MDGGLELWGGIFGLFLLSQACDMSDSLETYWRRKWKPTPVFLPGESQGQRSLVGYGPQGYKQLDPTGAIKHTAQLPANFNNGKLHMSLNQPNKSTK